MKKTCPKKITAFNHTETVEQSYTCSTLIKGYPHGRAKKLMITKKSNSKTKI